MPQPCTGEDDIWRGVVGSSRHISPYRRSVSPLRGGKKTENRPPPLTELNTATRASRSAGGNKTKNT